MLLFAFLHLLLSTTRFAEGTPLKSIDVRSVTFTAAANNPSVACHGPGCNIQFDTNYRSIREIIWSCLCVVFACTWTAVHPNVHGYGSTQWQRTKRRTWLFLLALFMPEVNLVWSVKQWLGAREITKWMRKEQRRLRREVSEGMDRMNPADVDGWSETTMVGQEDEEKPLLWKNPVRTIRSRNESNLDKPFIWTNVHSHFLQMGGYIFMFERGPCYVDMRYLFIDTPHMLGMHIKNMKRALLRRQDREEEILDKSKTSFLARTIAFIQILWFSANFIGRFIEKLTITKLEVASLAYIVMALLTYFFWMDKPLDVDCPILVTDPTTNGDFGVVYSAYNANFKPMKTFGPSEDEGDHSFAIVRIPVALITNILRGISNIGVGLLSLFVMTPPNEWNEACPTRPFSYPPLAFWDVDPVENLQLVDFLSLSSYVVFGGIHCIAWNFDPRSPAMQAMWRTASIAVTAVPLILLILSGVYFHASSGSNKWVYERYLMLILGLVVFIPARVALMVLPFLALLHLPQDAYKTVSWDDFFPHIG